MRRALDAIYDAAGALAALMLVALLLVILAQMGMRWASLPFPGSTDYAGYCMAAGSFLALAFTLRHGGHIRVGLVLERLSGPRRLALEIAATAVATGLAAFLAWYSIRLVRLSWRLGDVSQGQDATALWIPQVPMAVGAVLLAVAFLDRLVTLLRTGAEPPMPETGPARTE
jgi:TRAP-type C4-dicarboxylate transport system permease small subunit